MRTFIKLLTLCCARATVAAAVASLLIFASPVSASENDAEHSAETELRCVQEHEQEATGTTMSRHATPRTPLKRRTARQ